MFGFEHIEDKNFAVNGSPTWCKRDCINREYISLKKWTQEGFVAFSEVLMIKNMFWKKYTKSFEWSKSCYSYND